MFKKLLSKFGSAPKPLDIDFSIKKLAASTYSPYTLKMLQNNIPIAYNDKLSDENLACINYEQIDGSVAGFGVNKKYATSYNFSLAMEHESCHYAQSKVSYKFNSTLFLKPEDFYKSTRTKELQAHGAHLYKLIVDFTNDKLSPQDLDFQIENNQGILPEFLEAYTRKQVLYDNNEVLYALNDIKASGKLKKPQEIFPVFYYNSSGFLELMSMFSGQAIHDQGNALDYFDGFSADQKSQVVDEIKQKSGAKKLYSDNFTLDDSSRILNQDGFDYLGQLKPEQREDFWRNICWLDSSQRSQVESFKERVARLRC